MTAGGVPLYVQLRTGVAGILLDGFTGDSTFYTTPEDAASTSKAVETSSTDDRAELVLQLLLSGLEGPAPNVGHMLLGFDVEHGPEGEQTPRSRPIGCRHSFCMPDCLMMRCTDHSMPSSSLVGLCKVCSLSAVCLRAHSHRASRRDSAHVRQATAGPFSHHCANLSKLQDLSCEQHPPLLGKGARV